MDDDILKNCPGRSTGEDRTDRPSHEDRDDGNNIRSQPFQHELQHGNLQVSQRSAFSPQNVLSSTTSAQGFAENQLPINSIAHWLEHRSQPYLQGQSFQTSQPSAFSPPSELPATGLAQAFGEYQLPDDPKCDWRDLVSEESLQEMKKLQLPYSLQSEFIVTNLPLDFVRSQLPVYSNIDSGKQKPQLFQQEPQHWSFQTSHPPTYSPRRALSAPRFHQGFVGNQPAFIPSQKVLPSQADPDTAFASAATQHQYREYNQQQINPQELQPQASVLHMQSRSSTAMNYPQLLQLLSTRSIPGHSRGVSLNQLPQTSQFRIDQAEFIPSDKGLSSKATADRVLASAAAQHKYREYNQQTHQQQFEHQTYLLPKQFRSSTAMHSHLPTTATATETATSIASHGCQPVESSLKHKLTLEEIHQLIKKFMVKNKRINLPQKYVSAQLFKRFKEKFKRKFTENSFINWVTRFKNFPACLENMCHMKSLLECFMDDYQNSQSSTDSLPSNTASNIRGLETQAPIDTTNLQFLREVNLMLNPKSDGEQITKRTSNFGTDDSLWNNRLDSSTGEVKAHMMPQERSSHSDKKRNGVGTCLHQEHQPLMFVEQVSSTNEPYEEVQHVLNPMAPHCEVWTNERTVPSISTSNRNARHTVSYWKGVKTASQSMYTPNLWNFREPTKAPPKEKTTLGEMIRFAGSFKTWRLKQNLRQLDVSFELLKLYKADIGFQLISDFETFCDMYIDICKFAPILKEWFHEIY